VFGGKYNPQRALLKEGLNGKEEQPVCLKVMKKEPPRFVEFK